MGNDLRHTVRVLRRLPWYSLTVAGVVGLGMALATTVFAIVDGVLFTPVDLPESGRLYAVTVGFSDLDPDTYPASVGVADLDHWAAAAPDLPVTAYRSQPWGGFGEGVNDNAAGGARVMPNFFEVIGVQPMIGGFKPEDFEDRPTFEPVIVTYDLWQGRFRGDVNLIGRQFEYDRASHRGYQIVGIMPEGFRFPSDRTDVKFIGANVVDAETRIDPRRRSLPEIVLRMPASMDLAAVQARLDAGLAATAATFPQLGPKPEGWSDRGWRTQGPLDRAIIEPLSDKIGRRSRPLFGAVLAAVLLMVSLGAVNVSGLMAARTLDRQRELAVRRALGASGRSVARLVFLEALVLIGAGAAIGLAATPPLLHLALALLPEELTLLKPAVVDWRVAAFAATAAIGLAVPAAIWPIRRALRTPATTQADTARSSERVRNPGRWVVVGLQVAGAFVLTVSGSLVVGSLLSVYSNELPINTSGVVLVETYLQGSGAGMGRPSSEYAPRVTRAIERLREVPGAELVAATSAQVLRGGSWVSWFEAPEGAPNPRIEVDRQSVTADYYRMIQPQVVAGRLPTDDELATGAPVIVVSESVARAYWPGGVAVGRTLEQRGAPEAFRVVGVVKDVRWYAWDEEVASIYAPYGSTAREPMVNFLIRTAGNRGRLLTEALAVLDDVDHEIAPQRAATLDDLFVDSVRGRRFNSWLFGSFAAAGLLVAGVGLLGLLAMATARRTKEIGIRQALGSTRGGVVRLLLREQLGPVIAGLVLGGVLAAWATRFVEAYLYRVTVNDPRVWIAAAGLMLATAAIGALLPALRASRTDPISALRVE